jgi:hypothetical protein
LSAKYMYANIATTTSTMTSIIRTATTLTVANRDLRTLLIIKPGRLEASKSRAPGSGQGALVVSGYVAVSCGAPLTAALTTQMT